jgi:uncharacterized membrane protein
LQIAVGVATVAFVAGYPFLIGHAVTAYGVRVAAAGLLGIALLSWAKTGFARPQWLGGALALVAVLPLLLLAAALTGARIWMLLTPAGVQLVVAAALAASLAGEASVVERVARVMDEQLPDFALPYCRKMTVALCILFVVNALVIAVLAVAGREAASQTYARWGAYGLLASFLSVEFFVRKIRFRNYVDKPLDRLLARLFPPENTALGRRSQAYIRARRAELSRTRTASQPPA